jgi:hypothetical protein
MSLHTLNFIPPIFDVFLSCSSPGTIARYSRCCRSSRKAVINFTRRAYNINRHLTRFFSEPLEFRAVQAHTGTLISGSNALQFLDRTFYEGSDLDLYVDDQYRKEIGHYLQKEGYCFVPNGEQGPSFEGPTYQRCETTDFIRRSTEIELYGMRGVVGVFDFVKVGFPELKVQLITAIRTPLEAILNFHSSRFFNPLFLFSFSYFSAFS